MNAQIKIPNKELLDTYVKDCVCVTHRSPLLLSLIAIALVEEGYTSVQDYLNQQKELKQ